jgi:hypothetical protein
MLKEPGAQPVAVTAWSCTARTMLLSTHLQYEREAAAILSIPYESVMQLALIPVAYPIGTDFRPGPRAPLSGIVHWDTW